MGMAGSDVPRAAIGVLAAALVCMLAGQAGAGIAPQLRTRLLASGIVEPAVLDVVERESRARVFIALDLNAFAGLPRGARPDRARRRELVGPLADRALAAFEVAEFDLTHRFKTIPAIAGWIGTNGLSRLLEMPQVLGVELELSGGAQLTEAVPLIGADQLHDLGVTGRGVTVAVIDSGYDDDHPDLADDLVAEQCYCFGDFSGCCPNGWFEQSGGGAARDDNGHGTHVAGIVTSKGTEAPLGVAPDAEIVAVRVLDPLGRFCCLSDVVKALEWVRDSAPEVNVVNMSIGTNDTYAGDCDSATFSISAMSDVVEDLVDDGVVVVAASGNDASGDRMVAPACISDVISVGAVWDSAEGPHHFGACSDNLTAADMVTCFSNSSTTTDVFGPGALMTSTSRGGGSETQVGTSHSTPMVAGCSALLFDVDPTLTPGRIEEVLEASPVRVRDSKNGRYYPRIDCLDAVGLVTPTTSSSTTITTVTTTTTTTTTSSTTTTTLAPPVCGDADDDGEVSASDALRILQTAVGKRNDCPPERCDVVGRNGIAASDALAALKIGVGKVVNHDCPPPA